MSYTRVEMQKAIATLRQSQDLADSYLVTVGALSARGRFIPTVIDARYWFAQLYAITTKFEIAAVRQGKFKYPGFTLTFIPIFFDMYASAVRKNRSNKNKGVSRLWMQHFKHADSVKPDNLLEIVNCISSGAVAHIVGDMSIALAHAYFMYDRPDRPEFNEMKGDFMGPASRQLFMRVQARFFMKLGIRSMPMRPELGQFVIGAGSNVMNMGPQLGDIWKWRETAWRQADARIKMMRGIMRTAPMGHPLL